MGPDRPTNVSRLALLAASTIRISSGLKSSFSSLAIGGISGAISMSGDNETW